MKSAYFSLVFLLFLLAACAQKPVKPEPPVSAAPEKVEPKPVELPKQELTQGSLYQFLLAEIASQRGELGISSATYLDLAKNTRDPRIARRATEVAIYSRLPEIALEAATLWLELDPSSLHARQTVSTLLVNLGRLDDTRVHLEKLLQGLPGESVGQGFLQLNNLLSKHSDKTAALALVRELAKPYPNLAEAHFALAQAASNAGQHEAALEAVKKAGELRPGWELAALLQVQILQKTSNALALEHLQSFLRKHPKARDIRLSFARLLVTEKKYAEARNQFQQLTNDFPGNPDVALAVGLLSLELKDYDAAETTLRQVLDLNYKDPDAVRYYLGQVFEEKKDYDEALKWFGSVEQGEQYLPAQSKYAGMLAKQGKLDTARKYLQQVPAQNNQQRVQLILTEAHLLREASAYSEAFDLLERALEKLPNFPDLLYDYAMAAEKIERFDILETNLRKLIQIKPDHAHAYNALGYTLADRNDRLQEALQLIEKALKLAPDDPFIMDSMGWVQYRLGNISVGLGYLRRAFSSRPDPEIAAHLGEVLWAHGEKEEAKKIWKSTLKDNPKNEVLLNTIKRFVP